jgi:hypothetical protein
LLRDRSVSLRIREEWRSALGHVRQCKCEGSKYLPGTNPIRSFEADIVFVENLRRDREVGCDKEAKRKVWRVRSMAMS